MIKLKKRALHKDFWQEIKKSKSRFFSILLIVALGVAFFSGVRASEPDMRLTADDYYDETKLMDLRVISTLGLTEDDVIALKHVSGVAEVEASYMIDILCDTKDSQEVLRFYSIPQKMNRVQVTSGRMPKEKNECLLDNRLSSTHRIGETIQIYSEDAEVTDTLADTEFKVTGFGDSPYFISFDRGSTTVGSGQVSGFAMVPEESFVTEAYTQIEMKVEDSDAVISHSEEYEAIVDLVKERVEAIEEERCEWRYETLRLDTEKKIKDAKNELEDGKRESEEKLADAKQKIEDGENELKRGKEELKKKKQELEDGKKQIEENEKKLEESKTKLAEGKAQLSQAKMTVSAGEVAIAQAKSQIASAEVDLELTKAKVPNVLLSMEELAAMIAEGEAQLKQAKDQMAAAEAQVESGKAQIVANEAEITKGEQEIQNGEKALEEAKNQIADGEKQIAEAEEQLKQAEKELADAKKQYEDGKKEAEEKISDGEEQIKKAEEALNEIEPAEWYIYGRETLPAYSEFGQNADRIGAIGKVFPVIFFLVAALVSLTTMTRMVEEQRTQIGTLKALGYQKGDIAMKYIGYALITTLGGSILGVLIGEKILPFIIIISYKIMYPSLGDPVIPYNMYYASLGTGLALLCTLGATMLACYKELAAQPAQLMRPAAPKSGKRVLLERIRFFWKRLSFSQKATIRNLVRYKKRFFMTVFGIGGCMALLIVGFGLRDSIMNIAEIQYNHIQLYDAMLNVHSDSSKEEKEELKQYLNDQDGIESFVSTFMKSVDVVQNDTTRNAYLMVPESPQELKKYIKFQSRTSEETYELSDDAVIITEQMADALGVKEGDSVSLKSGDEKEKSVTIGHITENYMMHYVYMTANLYQELYGEEPSYDMILIDLADDKLEEEEHIGKSVLEQPAAYAMTYTSTNRETIEQMLGSLNIVIVVLIISAGMLAFVVLYNLNNINITERRRELATLKVLGFFDSEVAAYVYRENIWLTLIGAGVGAFLGMILHQFVIITVEVDMVMFGREVSLISYCISAALTCVFSALVNYSMYYKLKKIDMVESLKSIE